MIDFFVRDTRYFVIPGSHSDTASYCRSRHGAALAFFETRTEVREVSQQLVTLDNFDQLEDTTDIWVGGRSNDNGTISIVKIIQGNSTYLDDMFKKIVIG